MAHKILVDTSVLIDIQRNNPETLERFEKLFEKCAVSRITAMECLAGSRNKVEKKINKDFIEQIPILQIDEEISLLAYTLLDKYSLKYGIGLADCFIASTCIHFGLKLWTLNVKHFNKISELTLM